MFKALFLIYWIWAIHYLFDFINESIYFVLGATIATIGMIALLANSFRMFLSMKTITILSLFGIGWFIYITVLDVKGTFSDKNWLNAIWVSVDLLSWLFCLRTFEGTTVGVYITSIIKIVDNMPKLIWGKMNDTTK